MCVQKKLNVRVEVQSKELEKILNTFVWFHREIFISYSPAKSKVQINLSLCLAKHYTMKTYLFLS